MIPDADYDQIRYAERVIGASLVSLLPETDSWAIVDALSVDDLSTQGVEILALNDHKLWRVTSRKDEDTPRVVTADMVPLEGDLRIAIGDAVEYEESGAYRLTRTWWFRFPHSTGVAFQANWPLGVERRSRPKQIADALCAECGWEVGPVPFDLDE